MSINKTSKLLRILKTHTGLIQTKPVGKELRFDYNFQGFHLPVVEPYLMSEGYLQKKYFWIYNFFDYSHLHDYCREDILSGRNNVNNKFTGTANPHSSLLHLAYASCGRVFSCRLEE